jgi:Sap, sulfolipid-1-addressing protein
VPVQAIPLALISSLYPLGLAAILLLARAPRPRPKESVFLAGALACTLAVGFVVVFALHGAGIGQSSQRSSQYWLRLVSGVLFVAAAVVLARRPPKPHRGPSRMSRAASQGGLFAIFVAGVALYLPSPTYLAALEEVGSTKMSPAATAVWVLIVVALVLITVEVPVLLFLLAPGWTVPKLEAVNAWLDRHGHTLLVWVVGALGLWLFLEGLVGLL